MEPNKNNIDYEKQIARMVSFIDQEADERVKEMDAKTDELACIQKGNDMAAERKNIDKHFRKMENFLIIDVARSKSQETTKSRKWISEILHDHITQIKTEAVNRLMKAIEDTASYNNLLKRLITQAIFILNEKQVSFFL